MRVLVSLPKRKPPTPGPVRSNARPQLLPWERLGAEQGWVSSTRPPVQIPLDVRWPPYVELVGVNLKRKLIAPGDPVQIEYVFHCSKPLPEGVELFFHADFPSPPGWQNVGHTPAFGSQPVAKWQAGQYIRDVDEILTQPTWGTGEAVLRLGFYDVASGKRLEPVGSAVVDHGARAATVTLSRQAP